MRSEMPKVYRDLLALRGLFSAESAFCKYSRGLDGDGSHVEPCDEYCVRRCILGGMNFVAGDDEDDGERFHAMQAAFGMSLYDLASYNNANGRLAVLNLIDTAIAKVGGK